jgi:hypothetical protein
MLRKYLQYENQEQARARLTKIFRVNFGDSASLDYIFSYRIQLAMFRISHLTENVFSDRVACHLYLELFLLFHATKHYNEQYTKYWIMKYYPNQLNTNQIQDIHEIVLRYSKRHYGCFCC